MAIRGYYESPLHDDPWIESALDVRDRNGNSLPGYGWIFPVGDGEINVGIGLLSTFRDFKSVNTTHLMNEFAATAPELLGDRPRDRDVGARPAGVCRWAARSSPRSDPRGSSSATPPGSINPFNGEGIDYAYETGRMAAGLLDEALQHRRRHRRCSATRRCSNEEYGLYFKVARLFAKVIGQPALMRELTRVGMQSRTLMEWVLRIMANLLRDDEIGPAEAAYRPSPSWPGSSPSPPPPDPSFPLPRPVLA